jgi:hypothetical protein
MKIRPVGAEIFHADGQTDKTQQIVAFGNFGNAPINDISKVPFSTQLQTSEIRAISLLHITVKQSRRKAVITQN